MQTENQQVIDLTVEGTEINLTLVLRVRMDIGQE